MTISCGKMIQYFSSKCIYSILSFFKIINFIESITVTLLLIHISISKLELLRLNQKLFLKAICHLQVYLPHPLLSHTKAFLKHFKIRCHQIRYVWYLLDSLCRKPDSSKQTGRLYCHPPIE